jgi:ADP-dependent NAD(P)H-hydrate dehydratase / NAD(P)H-hydrate epimerase
MTDKNRSGDPARTVYGRQHVPLPTAAEAAAADAEAREGFGVPQRLLMENAGRTAAQLLHRLYPRGVIVGVAGSGNNGGDLLVMLRVLLGWGRDVRVVAAARRPPDAALAHGWDVPITDDPDEAGKVLGTADVIVDGLLGTGATGPPREPIASWIRRINTAMRPVVALDLPSGVDATSGRVPAEAVRAAVTVAFGWPKLGLLLHPAREYCGRLISVEIGFPPATAGAMSARLITPDWVRSRIQPRAASAHKSSAGRLLVLAGSSGMAGAAALTVEAALRAGAGLLRVASDSDNRVVLQTLVPEATFLDRDHLDAEDLETMHALVAGPGMGQTSQSRASLQRALSLMPGKPVLLDADALNVLSPDTGVLRQVGGGRSLIITPHARELSRLTGVELDAILADPCGAARSAAQRFNCTVLLKGQPSLIATADGAVLVNTTGSSDVATAGMGDQLAGTVGAFLAAGADPLSATGVGLFISGRAADLNGLGRSLGPRDVSARLADAIADPGAAECDLGLPFVTFDQPPRW